MNIAGIDYSTKAIDLVTIPHDEPGAPQWHTFPLEGDGAFDRARDVANALHGRSSAFWDDILAVGIEHPGGHYGTQAMIRIQGAILSCIPARMLVQPLSPARWRKLVGISGNSTKEQVLIFSAVKLGERTDGQWPQDAHDAHLIALATRTLISTPATA